MLLWQTEKTDVTPAGAEGGKAPAASTEEAPKTAEASAADISAVFDDVAPQSEHVSCE